MKLRKHSLNLLTMILFGAAAILSGCATTGMDRSVRASNSIREVDREIRKLIVQIDTTSISLNALVNSVPPDLKKNFDTYSENVSKLENEGKREIKRMDEMKARNNEYFAEWEKEGSAYKNREIRELSEERRNKLAEIYAKVPAAAIGVRSSYLTYLNDLKEIQKYLSNDLTPKGIEAITPVAKKSAQDRDELTASLKPVIIALDEIKFELYRENK